MAHFLGAGGATQFLKALDSKGDAPAAKLLPDAAAANPNIFYDGSGHAKTVREIYQAVAFKIEKDASAFAGDSPSTMPAASPSASFAVASLGSPLGLGSDAPRESAGISSLGHTVDWSGVKLSAPMLQMLNVVALAALKMNENNDDGQSAPQALPRPANPRIEHSA